MHSAYTPAARLSSQRLGQLVYASWLALLATTTLMATTANAKTTCDTSLGEAYPYCVSVPDDAGSDSMPTVLFLQGRGARGSASQVETLVSLQDVIGDVWVGLPSRSFVADPELYEHNYSSLSHLDCCFAYSPRMMALGNSSTNTNRATKAKHRPWLQRSLSPLYLLLQIH